MALTVDAKCTADTVISAVNGATGKTSTNLTVTASATCLFAILIFDGSATLTSPAMHWDSTGTNVAMTQIGTTVTVSTVGQIMMFGLVNPVAGAKTLKATWSGTGTGYMASMSFAGSVTSSVAACFTNAVTATPTGATGTQNITGASGNYAICANGNDDQTYTTFIHATSSTLLFSDASENYAGCAYAPETGTTTAFSWAQAGSEQNVVAGCTVTAAASGTNASATGVAGTGSPGTVTASIGANDTGVTGTGGVGTVTASIGANDTGVTGTGGVGTLAGSIGGSLTGVTGTGGVGTAAAQIGAASLGVAGTSGVGTFTGQSGGTIGGVGGTGGAGLDGAQLSVLPGGVAGIGQVGNLSTPGTVNASITGVAGTGQPGTLTDQIGISLSGVGGTGQPGSFTTETDASVTLTGVQGVGQAGILTTSSSSVAPAAPIQGGPGDDDDEAGVDARRQQWLEWSRKRRLKEKAKLATPQPVVAKAVPAVVPIQPGQSLLERNLHAQRLQIMQQAIADQAAAEAQRLQDEDDEEAIALLMNA
jgi:hypothetical protein